MQPARKLATYEDLLEVPGNLVAELIAGEVFTQPRPATRHSRVASVLGIGLGGPFDIGSNGPGGWWILDEPELHLGRDVLVPDLAGWRRERVAMLSDEAFISIAPDWVCEVLSPGTARHDRLRKLPVYLREKVQHVWLIDPEPRILEVFRRTDSGWLLVATHDGDEVVRAEPFDAVELRLSDLWLQTP